MKKYELLLVLPGTLDEKQAESQSQEIFSLVKENSSDTEIMTIGKNRLAYPVKQIRYGYFYTIVFNAESEQLKVIQDKLALMRDVLRALVSQFNTGLTASQKIAYTTDNLGVTTMMEREAALPVASAPVVPTATAEEKVAELVKEEVVDVPATSASAAARNIDKLDLESINKKLDDLMSGDVMPGV